MVWRVFALLFALAFMVTDVQSAPGQRVALVIAISENAANSLPPDGCVEPGSSPSLGEPARTGAREVARALREIGFEIFSDQPGASGVSTNGDPLFDLPRDRFRDVIRDFQDRARTAQTAVIVYIGHGFAFDGRQYLVPQNAIWTPGADPTTAYIELEVLAGAAVASDNNVLLIDACRNPGVNCVEGAPAGAIGATLFTEQERLIGVMSAQHRHRALANDGKAPAMSPFARSLAEHLRQPRATMTYVYGAVRRDVERDTATFFIEPQRPVIFASEFADFEVNEHDPPRSAQVVAANQIQQVAPLMGVVDARILLADLQHRNISLAAIDELAFRGNLDAAYLAAASYRGGLRSNSHNGLSFWAALAAPHADSGGNDREEAAGLYLLGLLYLEGRGVDRDPQRAERYLRRAAAQGFAKAQEVVGRILFCRSATGTIFDGRDTTICDQNETISFSTALERTQNRRRGIAYLREASAVRGDYRNLNATYLLGRILLEGTNNAPREPQAGLAMLQDAARRGLPGAHEYLCYHYERERDYPRARSHCESAAEDRNELNQGDVLALARLGRAYAQADDPLSNQVYDPIRARTLLERAVRDTPGRDRPRTACAFFLLADMYEDGVGGAVNAEGARELTRLGRRQHDADRARQIRQCMQVHGGSE